MRGGGGRALPVAGRNEPYAEGRIRSRARPKIYHEGMLLCIREGHLGGKLSGTAVGEIGGETDEVRLGLPPRYLPRGSIARLPG